MADVSREGRWWLLVGMLPGLLLCAARLRLDLWYDEVYTLYNFAARPAAEIVTDYSAPNNHILFTLLLRPVYLVALGSGAWWLLRCLPLLISAATLWLTYCLGRLLGGWPAAVVATWLLGLCQMFLIHTMQLRGYGLSMLLLVWLVDRALRGGVQREDALQTDDASSHGHWLGWPAAAVALGGAAFLYVVPTNLLFMLPLMLAVVIRAAARPGRRGLNAARALTPWGVALLLAGICYAPVAGQLLAMRPGSAGGSGAAVSAGRALVGFYRAALRDAWPVAGVAVVSGAVMLAERTWAAWRHRRSATIERASTARGPCRGATVGRDLADRDAGGRVALENLGMLAVGTALMLIGPFLLAAALGAVPFVRNFTPALPLLAVALGSLLYGGVAGGMRWIVGRQVSATVPMLTSLALAGLVIGPRLASYGDRLVEARRVGRVQDGYYNYYAARFEPSRAVAFVRNDVADGRPYELCYFVEDHFNLLHALVTEALPVRRPREAEPQRKGTERWRYFFDTDSPPHRHEWICQRAGETWREAPIVAEFGFFRVRRLPPQRDGAARNDASLRSDNRPPRRAARRP